MTWIPLLLFVLPQTWRPEPFNLKLAPVPPAHHSVWVDGALTETGQILACYTNILYHWDTDGSLIRTLGKSDFQIRSFHYQSGYYLLSGLFRGEPTCFMYRGSQELMSLANLYTPYFNQVGQYLFIYNSELNVFDTKNNLWGDFYPHLAKALRLNLASVPPQVEDPQFEFVKVNQRLLDLLLNFKRIWIEHQEQTYLVMNQVEPRIYLYTSESITREYEDGVQMETATPYKELVLSKFRKVPAQLWTPTKTMRKEEAFASYRRWWEELGLIVYFGRLSDGFAVVFQIPDFEGAKYLGHHLGVQALDSQLDPVGSLLESKGDSLGCLNNQVAFFKWEGPEGDLPVATFFELELGPTRPVILNNRAAQMTEAPY